MFAIIYVYVVCEIWQKIAFFKNHISLIAMATCIVRKIKLVNCFFLYIYKIWKSYLELYTSALGVEYHKDADLVGCEAILLVRNQYTP